MPNACEIQSKKLYNLYIYLYDLYNCGLYRPTLCIPIYSTSFNVFTLFSEHIYAYFTGPFTHTTRWATNNIFTDQSGGPRQYGILYTLTKYRVVQSVTWRYQKIKSVIQLLFKLGGRIPYLGRLVPTQWWTFLFVQATYVLFLKYFKAGRS